MLYRRIKDFAAGVLASIWSAVFWLLGRLRSGATPLLVPKGGQNIWVLAPHPDDEIIGCAYAMMRHAMAGDRVITIFVTDGRRSRAFGLGPEDMAPRRRAEAEQSQSALGLTEFRWLGLPEGEWNSVDLVAALRSLCQTVEPDVIYAPSRVDFHPEHLKVAYSLGQFLGESGVQPTVRIAQFQVPLTSVLANVVASGDGLYEMAAPARAAYRTQIFSLEPGRRMRRYAGAFHRLGAEVEEYWQLSATSYRVVHAEHAPSWPNSPFDPIRYRPWADPLRFARGRAERRRLRERASVQQFETKRGDWSGPKR